MSDSFSVAIGLFCEKLGLGWIFILSLGLFFVFFLFELLYTIFKKTNKKIYASHFIVLFSLSIEQICLSYFAFNSYFILLYALLFLSFGVLFFVPIYIIEKKCEQIKVDDSQKKFINFLDKKIEKSSSENKVFPFGALDNTISNSNAEKILKAVEKKPIKEKENINFSHVKNIISKLDLVSLSNADIRQIKDLKTNVYLAENGGIDQELQGRINDGLGALLKIMAKYGV